MSWPTPRANQLIDAMIVAEGGDAAFIRAVRISVPTVDDMAQARAVAANTLAHAAFDLAFGGDIPEREFVVFLGSRWAPVGAANDPTNLNANWVVNVLYALKPSGDTT